MHWLRYGALAMTEEDEDDAPPCPVCRVELEIRCLAHKANSEVSWHKFEYYCTECGYRGIEWETVE